MSEGSGGLIQQVHHGVSINVNIPDRNVSFQPEIFRLEDLVGARIVKDCFRMNTRLVGKGTVSAIITQV